MREASSGIDTAARACDTAAQAGINELDQCPGTMPGLDTLLPFEISEYETLRRSSRSDSSRRADDLRSLYAEIAAHWRRTGRSAK